MARINKLFGVDEAERKFKKEKRFLLVTLIMFSISYILTLARNAIVFQLTTTQGVGKLGDFFCTSNFRQSMVNIITFLITEWLPYLVIFILNYKNFNTMDEQDKFMKKKYDDELKRQKKKAAKEINIELSEDSSDMENSDDEASQYRETVVVFDR